MPIASMADMRREEEEKKKAKGNGKGTESYAGGEKSGMAIYNPEDEQDQWKQMQAHASSSNGETGGAVVTLWRDGFSINDGPLRPPGDPLNKKFLDEIARGICPEELKKGPDEDVHVSVVDKRGEEYKAAEAIGSATAARKPAAPAKIENAIASQSDGQVTVDASKPTTKIQIRFHDGSKKAQEFNEDHTVGDLRALCSQITGKPMTVKGGFPPRPVTDDSQTLKVAGLCGAAVTVAPA